MLSEAQAVRLAVWLSFPSNHVAGTRFWSIPDQRMREDSALPAYFHSHDGWTRLLEKVKTDGYRITIATSFKEEAMGQWYVRFFKVAGNDHELGHVAVCPELSQAVIQAAIKVMEAKGVKG